MGTPVTIKKQNKPNQPGSLNCGPLHASLIAHFSYLQQPFGSTFFINFHNLHMTSAKINSTWFGKAFCLIKNRA